MVKQNCWEFRRCGRIPGGSRVKDFGMCPAYGERRLDKQHDGMNAGRACWVVAGTLCGGAVQGSFANKYDSCEKCDFYQLVRKEEGNHFHMSVLLLAKLK